MSDDVQTFRETIDCQNAVNDFGGFWWSLSGLRCISELFVAAAILAAVRIRHPAARRKSGARNFDARAANRPYGGWPRYSAAYTVEMRAQGWAGSAPAGSGICRPGADIPRWRQSVWRRRLQDFAQRTLARFIKYTASSCRDR